MEQVEQVTKKSWSVTKSSDQSQGMDKGIRNWVQYINGHGGKPRKHYSSGTVITKHRPELAANKPIVKARIGNFSGEIFL